MRQELTVRDRSAFLTTEAHSDAVAVDLAETLLESRVGPMLSCEPLERAPGESGRFHRFETAISATARFSDTGYQHVEHVGGAGASRERARLRALGEGIERYCLSLCRYDDFVDASYREIEDEALDPTTINAFTHSQLETRDLSPADLLEVPFHWTATRTLTDNERVCVPGQSLYLPFPAPVTIRQPISTGAAAGTDPGSALRRAIRELIERDAFMIGYLNELPFPAIETDSVESPVLDALLRDLDRMGWEVTILDATLDHPLRTCLAIAVNQTGRPLLSIGLDAQADMVEAATGAVMEAYQFALPEPDSPEDAATQESGPIRTMERRRDFWNAEERLETLEFWLRESTTVPLRHTEVAAESVVAAFADFLDENDLDCYMKDVTTTDVAAAGFSVVSAFVPGLQPLHLDETFKYLGTDRLYTVPVETGYLDEPRATDALLSVPHPFI